MIKLKDVARRARVSEATASLALNRKKGVNAMTRDRVLKAAETLGYTPNTIARGLATRRTHTIGLVVTDIENPFFGSTTRFVDEFVRERGYTLVLSVSNDELELEERIISYFIGKRVEGAIVVPTISLRRDFSCFANLQRHKIPFVQATTYYPGLESGCVMTDLRKGSYQLGEYLLGLGHRDILFLASHDSTVPVSSLRIDGLQRAMTEANIPSDHLLVVECERASFSCGYATTLKALEQRKPDSIVAINDITALGAERAAREKGLSIPRDVSVCGYDDVIFSRISEMPLTTVKQDIKQICRKTVDTLFDMIKGNASACKIYKILPELVIRESTGPCLHAEQRQEMR